MSHELNLAQRPFFNPRPVLRVTILLWVLGVAVAAFNVRLYFSHYSGSSEIRERQQQLEESIEVERRAVAELEAELASYDLTLHNEQSVFLNAKIAERSFSWSDLFDRLGEAMPADVRLTSLSPSFGERGRNRTRAQENGVLLGIRATAKSSEVVLEFVDSLFAHPSFRAPNLISESLQESRLIDFSLNVIYEARRPASATEASVEGAEAASGESGESGESAETADQASAEPGPGPEAAVPEAAAPAPDPARNPTAAGERRASG